MSAPKLCKDCKHYVESNSATYDRCKMRTIVYIQPSLVRSELPEKPRYSFCDIQRSFSWLDARMFGRCGREGRWWEEK